MSKTTFLPFARPTISENAVAEVVECIRSGWMATGPRVATFEQMLGDYHGNRQARCTSSATVGLQLPLEAIGLDEGDEVITTALSFVATLNTIVLAGGRPVLVDVHPDTLNMDVGQLEGAITPRTKAIMPVHFAGLPVDLNPLYALADKHGLRVVEDCAHAIGGAYDGARIGAFGDIQVMSFHPTKTSPRARAAPLSRTMALWSKGWNACVSMGLIALPSTGLPRTAHNNMTWSCRDTSST